MSILRSKSRRLAILPIVLSVVVLFPSLHLHSAYEHDEDGHLHQHPIIHADFLSTAIQEHDYLDREGVALGGRHFADFSQTNLSALTGHRVDSRTVKLPHAPRFVAIGIEETYLRLVLFARIFKQEHPPPPLEVHRSPIAPRSPPIFA